MSSIDSDIKEIAINKIKGDDYWEIWTSDGVEANRLERKGWEVDWENRTGPYVTCRVPIKALTIRSKKVVENMEKRSEEMKGKGFGKGKK
jgi:hypothetical protein